MLWSLLLLFATITQALSDLHYLGSQKHYVYQLPPQNVQQLSSPSAEASQHFPSVAKMDPLDINFPVKTVKKFTDANGNVQVVTSYTNANKNSAAKKNNQPEVKTKHIEIEEKSAPKKMQTSKTQTIKFPDQSGGMVNHEEHVSVKKGKSSSFMTETSYDKSKKNPPKKISVAGTGTEQQQGAARTKNHPQLSLPVAKKKELLPKDSKQTKKIASKDVNVPSSSSVKKVIKKPPESKRIVDIQHSASKERPLQGASSTFISDVEDIGSDEDGYDVARYDHSYEGPIIGVGPPLPPEGGGGFKKEGGQAYSHGDRFAKGQKGGKGHKSKETYSKGHEEKHGKEHNKGEERGEAGHKTGHLDEGKAYEQGHAEHKGSDGIHKQASKGHKKGHKTSGFRTVHHKDEYKKDEVFYDEEHDSGVEKKHGHEEGIHEQTKGGMTKKGHLDSGYKDAQKGYHTGVEEGHAYDKAQGHKAHQGHKSAGAHKEGFAKGQGHKAEKEHYDEGQKVW